VKFPAGGLCKRRIVLQLLRKRQSGDIFDFSDDLCSEYVRVAIRAVKHPNCSLPHAWFYTNRLFADPPDPGNGLPSWGADAQKWDARPQAGKTWSGPLQEVNGIRNKIPGHVGKIARYAGKRCGAIAKIAFDVSHQSAACPTGRVLRAIRCTVNGGPLAGRRLRDGSVVFAELQSFGRQLTFNDRS
jgi:hypothetical protein